MADSFAEAKSLHFCHRWHKHNRGGICDSGWKKNQKIEEKNIKEAFRYAAEFAAENCLLNGAFGYGQPIE